MEKGIETSEYTMVNRVVILGVAVAVVVTAFDLPFTPEGLQEYLTSISESAKDWAAVLAMPIATVVGVYTAARNYRKK